LSLKYYRLAADQGSSAAQYNLGLQYKNGEGAAKNLAEAKKWFTKAAEQGDEDAKARLKELEQMMAE